jgi:hypothetical protein
MGEREVQTAFLVSIRYGNRLDSMHHGAGHLIPPFPHWQLFAALPRQDFAKTFLPELPERRRSLVHDIDHQVRLLFPLEWP